MDNIIYPLHKCHSIYALVEFNQYLASGPKGWLDLNFLFLYLLFCWVLHTLICHHVSVHCPLIH